MRELNQFFATLDHFNPTLVQLECNDEIKAAAPSIKFQSHIGAIRILPLKPLFIVPKPNFNPTLVQLESMAQRDCLPSVNYFNPTLVQLE